VLAVWRPEAAIVSEGSGSAPHAMHGRIELITFLGPITRLDIRVEGDTEPVLVDLASSTASRFAIGEEVAITVPPEAIRLYA
jgi:putative spermidine/putrescine transport system ATP-binding protein